MPIVVLSVVPVALEGMLVVADVMVVFALFVRRLLAPLPQLLLLLLPALVSIIKMIMWTVVMVIAM